jgi:hypothetical protein
MYLFYIISPRTLVSFLSILHESRLTLGSRLHIRRSRPDHLLLPSYFVIHILLRKRNVLVTIPIGRLDGLHIRFAFLG